MFQPVSEFHSKDYLWQLVAAVETAPGTLRGLDRQRGAVGEAAI